MYTEQQAREIARSHIEDMYLHAETSFPGLPFGIEKGGTAVEAGIDEVDKYLAKYAGDTYDIVETNGRCIYRDVQWKKVQYTDQQAIKIAQRYIEEKHQNGITEFKGLPFGYEKGEDAVQAGNDVVNQYLEVHAKEGFTIIETTPPKVSNIRWLKTYVPKVNDIVEKPHTIAPVTVTPKLPPPEERYSEEKARQIAKAYVQRMHTYGQTAFKVLPFGQERSTIAMQSGSDEVAKYMTIHSVSNKQVKAMYEDVVWKEKKREETQIKEEELPKQQETVMQKKRNADFVVAKPVEKKKQKSMLSFNEEEDE